MRVLKLSLAGLLLVFSGNVFAGELQPDAVMQSASPRQIDVKSYINGSYNYLERSRYFTSGVSNRVNDIAENGVRLQQLFLSISSLPDNGFGAYTEMAAGLDAYSIAPYGWNADVFQIQNIGFAVPDAYLNYGYNGYNLRAGVMEAIAGFETFSYLNDANFSRGIIYGYVVPGVHAGLRGSKEINESLKIIAGLTNGWATLRQPGRIKALELGLEYNLSEKLTGLLDAYIGNQYLTDSSYSGPSGRLTLLDFFATYHYTEKLSFDCNLDYAVQSKAALPSGVNGRATWAAAAGFVNYQLGDHWRSTLRGEVLNDSEGFRTGVRQVWKELTLSFGYEPIKHLSFILETRHDFSNVGAFVDKSGVGSNNNQQSYALEAMYQFV